MFKNTGESAHDLHVSTKNISIYDLYYLSVHIEQFQWFFGWILFYSTSFFTFHCNSNEWIYVGRQ